MNKFILCYIFPMIFVVSCRKENKTDLIYPNVEFVYMMKGMLFLNSLDSPEKVLSYECCVDTVIYDKKAVDAFITLIDNLDNDTINSNCDFRVVSIIHYNDSSECVVCLGERWNTMVDNVRKKDNPLLFEFINNLLYDEMSTRRLIRRSFCMGGYADIIDTPEMKAKIDECFERIKNAGDVYPK